MLPVIDYPTFDITIPSTKKKKKFRPFNVGEEKLLLLGGQSKEPKDMYDAVKQVINNCAISKLNLEDIAPFDFDYIFIRLRAMSVSNILEIKYIDPEDSEKYDVKIDLNKVEVFFPKGTADPMIDLDGKVKLKLRYPTMKMMDDILIDLEDIDREEITPAMIADRLVVKTIDMIIDGEDIYPASESTPEELIKFVESIPGKAYANIRKFLEATPQIKHVVKYTTKAGTERSIELNGLSDFFTWQL